MADGRQANTGPGSAPTGSEPAAVTEPDGPLLADFRIVKKLGAGGMGTVYYAHQISLDRPVALKVLAAHVAADHDFVERFYREARISAKLDHPNIVRGLAVGTEGSLCYFAMELVDGESVDQVLARRGKLPIGDAVKIVLDVARALVHAEASGLVHRDIKPANIMVTHAGVVKLADLGLAKTTADDSGLTQAGALFGTPAYMAPEQARNARDVDIRCDIYALGVTLYHLVTGQKPFGGMTMHDMLAAKEKGRWEPLRRHSTDVPPALERVIDRMMAPDPSQRYATAAELVAALEGTQTASAHLTFLSSQLDVSQATRAAQQSVPSRVRHPGVRPALLAALVLVLALGGYAQWRSRGTVSDAASRTETTDSAARIVAAPHDSDRPVADDVANEQRQVALGVMLFKGLGSEGESDWRREALRDGLNAQLSQLSRVKVYSREFLDFLISRKGLTDIEAATQLGISKMLSGSFVAMQGTIRIETHVVDVKTGVLESSYTTVGREADFLDLQNQLVLGVIARLDLPVTAEEQQQLLAQRNTDEQALRMLLEAEGGAGPPTRDPTSERQSARPKWLARLGRLAVGVAVADDAVARNAILEVIERYRRAMETRDVQALSAVYTEFAPEHQAAQQRYFDNVRDLSITIENPDIAVVGDEAVVSYTRKDDFVDARTGRPMHVAVRLTKILRQEEGMWKMAWK